jgi:transposase
LEPILLAATIPCCATEHFTNTADDGSAATDGVVVLLLPTTCSGIDGYVDFSFVQEQVKGFYSATGRPSIDPEVLLRLLVVGDLYGITSERRLMEEVRMHLADRWFTRLSFDQEIPDHSTFSKNRHGRFRQSGVFQKVFEEIVQRCLERGLVEGRNLAVDGTLVIHGRTATRRNPNHHPVPRSRHLAGIACSSHVQY